MRKLQNGDLFPALVLRKVGGGGLNLPADLRGSFSVVLIYRGSWCPYCNAQLAAFKRAEDKLREQGIEVAALSVDNEAKADEIVQKYGLSFPVGFDADADAVAAATGAFVNRDPLFMQSTGFVLDADGRVVTAVYSSGAIGRLMPDDVIGFVRYLKQAA